VPHLTFTLDPELSAARRARLLRDIAALDGVAAVSMIDPDSPLPEFRGAGVIRLRKDADPQAVLTKLKIPGLSACHGAERKLITPPRPTRRRGEQP
jgi:hypothetical protein